QCSAGHCCALNQLWCGNQCRSISQCIALGAGKISSGYYHTCGVNQSGTLKCWGANFDGEIGDGTTTDRHTPTTINLANVAWLGAGVDHTCAVLASGVIDCWGANFSGQLGDNTTTNHTSPGAVSNISTAKAVASGYDFSCALLNSGSV